MATASMERRTTEATTAQDHNQDGGTRAAPDDGDTGGEYPGLYRGYDISAHQTTKNETSKGDDIAGYDALSDRDLNSDTLGGVGFLAIDEMKSQHMTSKQAQHVRNGMDEMKKKDRWVWNKLYPNEARKRTPLPRGCKTFLLEIFAGCAMLSTLAHYAGLPVSGPVDILYDPLHDLQTQAGRDFVDERVAADDPYLVTFLPVCGPWSTWQRVNMTKNAELEEDIGRRRKAWKPVIRWIVSSRSHSAVQKKATQLQFLPKPALSFSRCCSE